MTYRVLVIAGPTASGKSDLAMRIAERLPVEIVCCDSQQVYVGLDIGTGKPTATDRQLVPHHLLDVVLPSETFHAARWAALARTAIHHIVARGRVPLLVGGTGLYLRALLAGLFEAPPPIAALRDLHRDEARLLGVEALHARLAAIDPSTAARVMPRDLVRISRALEVYEQTGVPISVLRQRQIAPSDIAAAKLVLDPPLDLLRERIARRFDAMMASDLLGEARNLRTRFGNDARPLHSLGYKQLGEHLDGTVTLEEAVAAAKSATVAYARRQRTWFRKETNAWRAEATPDVDAVLTWWNA
jgi:tRNA dimethylallyltransferase